MEQYTFPPKPASAGALAALTPTVFFVREGEALQQRVEVALELSSPADEVELAARGPAGERVVPLGSLPPGRSACLAGLPDLRQPGEVTWELRAGGQLLDRQQVLWQPARQWTIHYSVGSHHDLGYTDLPSNLLREHDHFMDQVLDFCDQTDDFPEESRFHYTVEQAWSVLHWVAHRPAAQVERLARRLRQGRIEVTALFGNQTTELCSAEELARLLYPAIRLRRALGAPLRTAELNDIPGVAWGLASVLAGAGIRYFAPGIPDYFNWGRKVRFLWDESAVLKRDLPGAFWWEGPDGGRVLFWYGAGASGLGNLWNGAQAERDIPGCLAWLEGSGYPYEQVLVRVQGGHRDNSPPDLRFSLIARQWNARWAYPRLVVGTLTPFFEEFERAAGPTLKTLRGDIPGTDYPLGAASTPRETAINRSTHDLLGAAERLAVWAAVSAGVDYPAETLREAYDQMLLFDEHTWGMAHPVGPAQDACWSQKAQNAFRAAALAQDVFSKSANRLADQVRLDQEGYFLVVFNPLAQPRTDLAGVPAQEASPCGKPMHWEPVREGEPMQWVCGNAIGRGLVALPPDLLAPPADQALPLELVDLSSGQPVACQVLTLADPFAPRPHAAQRFGLGYSDPSSLSALNYDLAQVKDLFFLAENVPALGYKAYRVAPAPAGAAWPAETAAAGEGWLENRYYRLEVDPARGVVTSIFDKELGVELVDGEAPHGFNQLLTRDPRTGAVEAPQQVSVARGEPGPLVASLVVRGAGRGCPRLVQEITLYAGLKRIDFASRLLKDALPLIEHHFAFPFRLARPEWLYEAPGGPLRPLLDQFPGTNTQSYAVQRWVQLTGWQASQRVSITWASLDAPNVSFGGLWPSPVSQAHHGATPPGYGQAFPRPPGGFEKAHLFSWAAVSNYRTNFQPTQPADLLFRYSLTSGEAQAGPQAAADFGRAVASPLAGVIVRGPQAGSLPPSAGFCRLTPGNVRLQALKAAEDGDGIILRLVETAGLPAEARLELPFVEVEQVFQADLVEQNRSVLACEPHAVRATLPAFGTVTLRFRTARGRWPQAGGFWYD